MAMLIKNATILAMGGPHDATPFTSDLLIEADRIAAIGPGLAAPPGARIVDGQDRLVMPGLVNAHLHSGEALYKGRYDNLPLELWMLHTYPILAAQDLDERLIWLRSMLVAIDALKSGTTCLTDDVFEAPRQDLAKLGAVVDAYDTIGIRATVSGHVIDRNFLHTIPFTAEHVPADLAAEIAAQPRSTTAEYIAFSRAAIEAFHGRSGRIRYMVAPSAPQRCTAELMLAADELARAHKIPFHTHIVETKVQGVTGPVMFGKTLIAYMKDLGILHPGVTIAHSIWVTDADIAMMGEAACSVAHNAMSNQKLGAGIAPVRKLIDAGVNVGLGTDGIASIDSPRMFDVMHAASLLHKISTPDYRRWPDAAEILRMATINGAKSALIGDETGSLEPGKKADLLVLSLRTSSFVPRHDLRNHLVHCENGGSIELVVVNGEVVVEHGRLTRVDEAAILAELMERMPAFTARHEATEVANRRLAPAFDAIHRRCNAIDIGIHRLGTDTAYLD